MRMVGGDTSQGQPRRFHAGACLAFHGKAAGQGSGQRRAPAHSRHERQRGRRIALNPPGNCGGPRSASSSCRCRYALLQPCTRNIAGSAISRAWRAFFAHASGSECGGCTSMMRSTTRPYDGATPAVGSSQLDLWALGISAHGHGDCWRLRRDSVPRCRPLCRAGWRNRCRLCSIVVADVVWRMKGHLAGFPRPVNRGKMLFGLRQR